MPTTDSNSAIAQNPIFETKTSSKFKKYASDGLTVLAALAWREAKKLHWAITTRMTEADWRATAVPLLCSMHIEVLMELMGGNLARASKDANQKLISELYTKSAWKERGNSEAPCIYARVFCDTNTGRSLTPIELQKVIHRLRLYIKPDLIEEEVDLVKAIDDVRSTTAKKRYIREGRRHFFADKAIGDDANSRLHIVKEFCDSCEQWLIRGETRFTPSLAMPFQFDHIGSTLVFSKLSEKNAADNGESIWFINLFRSTCQTVLVDVDATWDLLDFVVCYCAEDGEVPVGEALITLLASAWHSQGTGFGVHPPGENVYCPDFDNMSYFEVRKVWKSCEDFRKDHTPFLVNIDRELEQLAAYPSKQSQRLATATSAADMQTEINIIRTRVAKAKNDARRRMKAKKAQFRQNIDNLKAYNAAPDYIEELEATYAELALRLERLGPVTDESPTREERMLPDLETLEQAEGIPRGPEIDSELPSPESAETVAESSGLQRKAVRRASSPKWYD
ncbi:Nn.00g100160.m01.CDS01 [Neocucurbitaria sp. VM-36]